MDQLDPIKTPRKRSEAITLNHMGNECILHDSGRKRVHVLNETALEILQLCDGATTVQSIVEKILAAHPSAQADVVRKDISETLHMFLSEHLIE
jgi:hypothetical protein